VEALDRYRQAVSWWLPRGQKTDVVAELAEDIRFEIDDGERQLGVRVHAIAEVAAHLLALAWWLGVRVPAIPDLGIDLTPTWRALHWPIAALLAASLAVALVDAIRPSWSRPRLVARLAVDAYALLLTGILLSAWPWVQVTATSVIPQAHADRIELWMNLTWMSVLLVIGAVCTARVMRLERRVARDEVLPPRLLARE
jgi:hypothetical protein